MAKVLLYLAVLGIVDATFWDDLKDNIKGKKKEEVEKKSAKESEKGFVPAFWGKLAETAKQNIMQFSDESEPSAILHNSYVHVTSCGNEQHALHIGEAHFDTNSLELHVKGHLKREITGGKVTMDLKLGKPLATMTKSEIMKRKIAWVASGKHYDEEALCRHFDRYQKTCPLKNGEHEFRFGFKRLPSAIIAGGYDMTVKAVDEMGEPVLCVRGSAEVSRGPQGELFRRLQDGTVNVSSTPRNLLKLEMFVLALLAAFTAW